MKIVEELLKYDFTVVCLDLRDDEIKQLNSENVRSIICDIPHDESANSAFTWIEKNLNGVDVLFNNAGITNCFGIFDHEMPMEELQKCMEVNFIAENGCTRLAYKSMMQKKQYGCIININSVARHRVIEMGDCKLDL